MFNKYSKLKNEIKGIKKELVGVDVCGNSFESPASYSLLGEVKTIEKRQSSISARQDKTDRLLYMLLDELGLSLEEGARLVKKKKQRK